MSNNIITLKTYTLPQEAYPLMTKLENEGIECFLDGENTISANPLLSNAVGGVKLKISEIDLQRAIKIFKELENNQQANKEYDVGNVSFSKGYEKIETYCPKCESINVFRKKRLWNCTIFAILFLPVYLLLRIQKKMHYCADCNHIWKQ
jgi:hypothetical protein